MLRTVQNLLSTCWLWISGGFQVDLQYFTVRRDRPCAGWGDAARSCEPTWFHVNGGRTPTDHEQNCLGHVDCKHSSTQEFYSGRNFATLSIETWSICTIFLLDELECPRYIGFHFMNLSPGHRMWWRGRRPHTKSWRWACESVAKSSRFYVWCKVASVSVQTLQVRQTMHDHPHGTLQARSTVGMRCREPACHWAS